MGAVGGVRVVRGITAAFQEIEQSGLEKGLWFP